MFVATAAVCAALLSTTDIVRVDAKAVVAGVNSLRGGNSASISTTDAVASLRGNQRTFISSERQLEGGGGENGEGNREEKND